MSQPINKEKPNCFIRFADTMAKGLVKAYTPCQEWCMKKCQKAWEKGKQTEPCVSDSQSMEDCAKRCRSWQYQSPLYRD